MKFIEIVNYFKEQKLKEGDILTIELNSGETDDYELMSPEIINATRLVESEGDEDDIEVPDDYIQVRLAPMPPFKRLEGFMTPFAREAQRKEEEAHNLEMESEIRMPFNFFISEIKSISKVTE